MEEWQASTVQRWESERASRPTAHELENWERTVSEIRARYKLAEGHRDRAELCHRLAVAYIKMEDYAQAMTWVDLGLAEGSEDWVRELQEDMALVLYLQDRKEEAMAILDELAQRPPLVPKAKPPKRITPRVTEEVILTLVCPHCDTDVPYGQLRCPACGAKVDDRFTLVRSTKDGRKVRLMEEVETHRVKRFSLILTEFTVDYDDPMNFLTAHRVRFMGGEIVTITEREWFMKANLLLLVFLYFVFGLLIWKTATVLGTTAGPLVFSIIMALVLLLPYSLFYLCVIFPNFLVGTYGMPLHDD